MGKKKDAKKAAKKEAKRLAEQEALDAQKQDGENEGEEDYAPELTELGTSVQEVRVKIAELEEDLEKVESNASAARRARKCTTALTVLMKEFRKISLDHHR